MKVSMNLKISPEKIAHFCRSHRIEKLSFFGSVLRKDFNPDSDIDVLIEFKPGEKIGLLGMSRIEMELSELLGCKVDLRTPAELSKYFRDDVLQNAEVQYAEGR